MPSPLVTVLMPAYNCEKYIGEAINAILRQTFRDFEFIIINDGSTDDTKNVILGFSDERIRFYENEKNLGIVKTLNKGLDNAKGKYILRTDADDIAKNDMIASLTDFMETNADYVACGGNMQLIGSDKIFSYPSNDTDLKVYTLNSCPFSHSTVIFLKSVLNGNTLRYNGDFKDAEDYALWSEMLLHGKFHNLNKITLLYRESNTQVTAGKEYRSNQVSSLSKIYAMHGEKYFGLNGNDAAIYAKLIAGDEILSTDELKQTGIIMMRVLHRNKETKMFDPSLLKNKLFIKWHWICFNSYHLGKAVFGIYFKYIISSRNLLRGRSILTHFLKSLRTV